MAIGLHSECIKRLLEKMPQYLANIRVDNDIFLNYKSTISLLLLEKMLPEIGKVRERINQYIGGELPLFSFTLEAIHRDFIENGTYNSKRKGALLNAFKNYADLGEVAKRIIQDFENLPEAYLISYELPIDIGSKIRETGAKYEISPKVKIASPDESFNTTYPLQSGIRQRDEHLFGYGILSIIGSERKWNQGTGYLQVETEGFIGQFWETTPLIGVITTLKAFIGLSLALRLLKVGEDPRALTFGMPIKTYLIVHRKAGEKFEIWDTPELPSDLSETLGKLAIDNLDGRLDTQEKIGDWVRTQLSDISLALRNPKAERILSAAEWFLDSYVGKNELLSFVQAMVVVEILLGDKAKSDLVGLEELLANRCAYLIAKSHSKRISVLEDFRKIYEVRSKIVHRGKSRLTFNERELFSKLQWICRRVIREELNLIAKDKEETP